jgi:hypothetical protein
LLHHSGADLAHLQDHTVTVTSSTHGLTAGGTTSPVAFRAQDITVYSELADLAIIAVLKGHFELVHHILALLFAATPASTTTTTKHIKDVSTASTATLLALLNSILTTLIIKGFLLGIREHLVRLLNLLEQLLITTTIGVMLHSKFSELFLNFRRSRVLLATEYSVVLLGVYWFALAPAASHSRVAAGEATAL